MKSEAYKRLCAILSAEFCNATPPLKSAWRIILHKVKEGKVKVYTPDTVEAAVERKDVGSFELLRCPKCGSIFTVNNERCPRCGEGRVINAYIGVPIDFGQQQASHTIHYEEPRRSTSRLILTLDDAVYPPRCVQEKGKYTSVMPINPSRPLSSLRRICTFSEKACRFRSMENGVEVCTAPPPRNGNNNKGNSGVFFKRVSGYRYVPALPSEGLTKPIYKAVFTVNNIEKGIPEFADLISKELKLSDQLFERVDFGTFKIWELGMFYVVGHTYLPRYRRMPVLVRDAHENLIFVGRYMETEGILFELKMDRVRQIVEELRDRFGMSVSDYTVAHSVAHVLLKAAAHVTGISLTEFGESIYVEFDSEPEKCGVEFDSEPEKCGMPASRIEILIYDDSPGGVGGVKSLVEALPDFAMHVVRASDVCPRGCRRACKACLYVENCGSLNYNLSWLAAYRYFRP